MPTLFLMQTHLVLVPLGCRLELNLVALLGNVCDTRRVSNCDIHHYISRVLSVTLTDHISRSEGVVAPQLSIPLLLVVHMRPETLFEHCLYLVPQRIMDFCTPPHVATGHPVTPIAQWRGVLRAPCTHTVTPSTLSASEVLSGFEA